jgi:hypothetical protein
VSSGAFIQVETDYGALRHFLDSVSQRAVFEAARKAGNTTLRRSRTEADRRVRAERNLKAKFVKSGLRMQFPSRRGIRSGRERMRWELGFSGKSVPLIKYKGTRKTKRGVTVNVSGRREKIQDAFIATMDSGHRGVFKRKGESRLPIEELFSTRVSDVAQNTGFVPAVHEFVQERFNEEWRRLAEVEIERARNKSLRRTRFR